MDFVGGRGGAGLMIVFWLYCSGLKRVIHNYTEIYIIYTRSFSYSRLQRGQGPKKMQLIGQGAKGGGCKIHGRKNLRNKETV